MSTEKTCGTCRFSEGEDHRDAPDDLPDGYFVCTLIKHEQVAPYRSKDRAEFTGLGAFVTDASGYFAALCVEADFGCNKWQPKIDPVPGQN